MSTRLDKLIAYLSPSWGAKREAWRQAERFSYRMATRSRVDKEPSSRPRGSADNQLELAREREEMVFRSRQLERDNVLADGLLTRSVENIVANGIRPQARTDDPAWNAQVEALFTAWAEDPKKCDVRGLSSLWELQALVQRSKARDGDCGTVLLENGQLQCVEADQIADPPGKRGDPHFIDGVEVDAAGRPIAYHVVDESAGYASGIYGVDRRSYPDRIAIPADKMLFLSRRKRIGQTRGEPVFAQSMWLFEQLDGTVEAVTIAARMAACFGLAIRRTGPFGNLPNVTGANGASYHEWSLEPGMVKELDPGDEVMQIAPQQPSSNFVEFSRLLARLVGVSLGLPLELVLLDFSQTNFSSARASLLQAYRTWRCEQSALIAHFLRPVYLWRVRKWIEDGDLDEREGWEKHDWSPPGWQWVDPKAEVEANLAAIDAGLRTRHEVLAEQGRDFEEVVSVLETEREALEAAKIPIVRSVATRDPAPPPGGTAPQGGASQNGAAATGEKSENSLEKVERMYTSAVGLGAAIARREDGATGPVEVMHTYSTPQIDALARGLAGMMGHLERAEAARAEESRLTATFVAGTLEALRAMRPPEVRAMFQAPPHAPVATPTINITVETPPMERETKTSVKRLANGDVSEMVSQSFEKRVEE